MNLPPFLISDSIVLSFPSPVLRTLRIKAKRLRIKAKLQGRIVTVCRLSSDRAKRLQPFRPTTDESRLLCPTPTSIKTIVMYFKKKEFSIQGLRCSVSSLSPSRFLSPRPPPPPPPLLSVFHPHRVKKQKDGNHLGSFGNSRASQSRQSQVISSQF